MNGKKESSQALSIFSLLFVIMYPYPLSSRFTLFLAFLLVQKYWGIFCQPSQYLLLSSPANLISSGYIGMVFYFEIKGHGSTYMFESEYKVCQLKKGRIFHLSMPIRSWFSLWLLTFPFGQPSRKVKMERKTPSRDVKRVPASKCIPQSCTIGNQTTTIYFFI